MTVREVAAVFRPRYEQAAEQDRASRGDTARRRVLAEWSDALDTAEPNQPKQDDFHEVLDRTFHSWQRSVGRGAGR